MIRFWSTHELPNGQLSRRDWLQLGCAFGLGGLTSSLQGSQSKPPQRAKSVIFVYASGGQSQIDLWDMKPNAPEEVRGIFKPISTTVSGLQVCEHMPKIAKIANRFTLLRNLSHDDLDHGSASYLALTGHFHTRKSSNPLPKPTDYPTYGSILHRVRPSKALPFSAVHVNGPAQVPEIQAPGQFSGFLGRGVEPLLLGDVTQGGIALDGLGPLPDVTESRQKARRTLLESVENSCRYLEQNREFMQMRTSYQQAYQLLASKECRRAIDLRFEPSAIRERYGMHRSGQACLMARRLVEIGVPWITVIWNHSNRGQDRDVTNTDIYGWDTHNDIFSALKTHLLPRFDESFSALIEDLEQRGLLDETLVVCMGEFGRAPKVALEKNFKGTSPGRKHWAAAYSIIMAGAGVGKGHIVGATDRMGGYVKGKTYGPWDVAATLFAALGIDPSSHYTDSNGRPYAITTGKPIDEIYQ